MSTVLFAALYFLQNRILDIEATHVSVYGADVCILSRYSDAEHLYNQPLPSLRPSLPHTLPYILPHFLVRHASGFGRISRSHLTCFTLETRRDRKKVVEEVQPGNDYVFQQAMHMYSTYRVLEKYCPIRRLRKFSGLFMLELKRKANVNSSVQSFSVFLHIHIIFVVPISEKTVQDGGRSIFSDHTVQCG